MPSFDVAMTEAGPVRPIDCETAVRRLWDYLDGRLPALPHAEVEAHLTECALCPPHFAFARTMRDALASTAPATPDPTEAALRARVHDALRRHRTAEPE